MAYSAIPNYSAGDVWTADNQNAYIKDNFAAGVPDVFTAKGQLFFGTGADAGALLDIGAEGEFLTVDASTTTGAKYAAYTTNNIFAQYRVSTSQTLTAQVNFNTQVYDTASAVTTGASWKFTCPADEGGYYAISCNVNCNATSGWNAGDSVFLLLYKNNSTLDAPAYLDLEYMPAAGTHAPTLSGHAVVSLAAGDYIDVRVDKNTANAITSSTGINNSVISIARLF